MPVELSGKNSENSFIIQDILRQAHNYNRWLFESVEPALGRRVLDIGSGFGNVTRLLLDREHVVSIDVETFYVEYLEEAFASADNFEAHCCDITSDASEFLMEKKLDSAMCLNVLEHIEDDVGFLRRIHEILLPGGGLGLLVPALQVLYGSMDSADLHFRRYGRPDLRAKLEQAGFEVEDLRFLNRLGAIGWFVNGRILRREIIPAGQLGFYEKIIPWMRRAETLLPLPFGQSLVAIARKR